MSMYRHIYMHVLLRIFKDLFAIFMPCKFYHLNNNKVKMRKIMLKRDK